MDKLLATITLGGTITIVVFVVIFAGLAIAALWYLTRRERRRFKASRVSMAVKLENVEKMLKGELIKAKGNTKFTITTIELDNVGEVKAAAGARFVKDLLEMIAGRAVRQYDYPLTVARYGNNRLVYISKRLNNAKQLKQIERVMDAMKDPFVTPEGSELVAKCNYSAVNFPEAGREYSAIVRSIELGIADALRKGGVSIGIEQLADEAGSLSSYLKVKRAIDKGELTVGFTPVVNVYNKERIGFTARISSGEVDYAAIMNASGGGDWLAKWLYDEVFMAIDKLIGRSGALIMPELPCPLNEVFAAYYKEKTGEKEAYREQTILTVAASEAASGGGALPTDGNIALVFSGGELKNETREAVRRLKPRYAVIDLASESVGAEYVSAIRELLEPYDTVLILGGISDKSGAELAAANGIEYVGGELYGGEMGLTELIDAL